MRELSVASIKPRTARAREVPQLNTVCMESSEGEIAKPIPLPNHRAAATAFLAPAAVTLTSTVMPR
jgi:hypothetical protein